LLNVDRGGVLRQLLITKTITECIQHRHKQDDCDRNADEPVAIVEICLAANSCASEHGSEKEQHHDSTDVDENLRDRDKLSCQQDVLRRDTSKH